MKVQWLVPGHARQGRRAAGDPAEQQRPVPERRADPGRTAVGRHDPDASDGDVMNVAFPFRADARGRTARADDQAHVRDLIEQVLFTAPGERVNRPTFGSGLLQLVFDPNRQEVATATQMLVQSSLQQWLGDLIEVEDATVEGGSEKLVVTIVYRLVRTQERRVEQFGEAAAMTTELYCPEGRRREVVRASTLNGIDFLEVLASHRTLLVHCLRPIDELDERQRRDRGRRARDRRRGRVGGARRQGRRAAAARPSRRASTSCRTRLPRSSSARRAPATSRPTSLRLVRTPANPDEPAPASTSCSRRRRSRSRSTARASSTARTDERCEEPEPPAPQIDYLAKDYASFRRLMLDRLSVLVPDWQERSAADTLMTLVELLAYSADSLSYFQDAAATEAYLGTARLRASVRRHARLVDYPMHDGASARVWVALDGQRRDGRRRAAARHDGADRRGRRRHAAGRRRCRRGALAGRARVRDAARASALQARATRSRCTRGATARAACPPAPRGRRWSARRPTSRCTPATCCILEEVRDPESGNSEDADPAHRHAVRLAADPVARRDTAPATAVDLVEIRWHDADALPFALRLETRDGEVACVARGNVVLADHGGTILEADGDIERETLGTAPDGRLFRPSLARRGVTQSQPYDDRAGPSAARSGRRRASTRGAPCRPSPCSPTASAGSRCASCSTATASPPTSCSRPRRTDQRRSVSATACSAACRRRSAEFTATYRVGNGRAGQRRRRRAAAASSPTCRSPP